MGDAAADSGAKRETKARRKQPRPTAKSLANLAPPFRAGQPSANPSGRPAMPPDLRLRALQAAPDAMGVAIAVVENTRAAQAEFARAAAAGKPLAGVPGAYPDTHIRWAVDTVLDRALGRPDVAVSVTGDASSPLADATPTERLAVYQRVLEQLRAEALAPALPDIIAAPDKPSP